MKAIRFSYVENMRKGKNMAVKITKSSFGKYPDGRDVTLYNGE